MSATSSKPDSLDMLRSWCVRLRFLWLAATLGQMIFIYWSSARTWGGAGGGLHPGITNFVHFILYGGIATSAYLAWNGFQAGRIPPVVLIWAGTTAFGLGDEIHQSFIPGRDFSLWDVGTDAAGAVFATTVLDRLFRTGRERIPLILLVSFGLGLAFSFIFPVILPNL